MPLIIDGNKQVNTSILDIFNALQQQLYVSKIDKLNKSVLKSDNLMVQCPIHSNGHEKSDKERVLGTIGSVKPFEYMDNCPVV